MAGIIIPPVKARHIPPFRHGHYPFHRLKGSRTALPRQQTLHALLEWQRDEALARSHLDESACNLAWEEGRKMPLEQALEIALA